jgi:hypothetical protein
MIYTFIEYRRRHRRARHVSLSLPIYISKGFIMKTLTLQNDTQAVIEPKFKDSYGLPIAAPSSTSATATATSSDATLFSAAIDADGNVLVIAVPGAAGTGTLTYINGSLTDTGDVVISAPAAASVELDSADAVITAQTPASAPVLAPAVPDTAIGPGLAPLA